MLNVAELLRRFSTDLENLLVPGRDGGFLVAVSGGADSTALLRLFQLARDQGLGTSATKPIVVGHVHHGIRGAEADADCDFVRSLAAQWNMPFAHGEIAVPELAEATGKSLEEAAREARYSLFAQWASEHDLGYVVTAHHAGDQAETVLLRVARGTGVYGLAGIPSRRALHGDAPGTFVIRPLLEWPRERLVDFIGYLNQPHCEDSTNSDCSIPRNAVRNEVLPLMRTKVHPGIFASLNRLAKTSRALTEDLDILSDEKWSSVRREDRDEAESVALSVEGLVSAPGSIRARLLRRAVETLAQRLHKAVPNFSLNQVAEISRRLVDEPGTDRVDITGGWSFQSEGEVLQVFLHSPTARVVNERPPLLTQMPLGERRELSWGEWFIRFERLDHRPEIPTSDQFSEVFDTEQLCGPLTVRARQPGEVFHPLGSPGSKKLKEFLRECGVSAAERDHFPLVFSGDTLLWVVGKRLAHPFRVTGGTKQWGKLTARRRS